MIVFDVLPPGVKQMGDNDWQRLGRVLSRGLKFRKGRQIGVAFVTPERIRLLNARYRHADHSTDVLSFSPEHENNKLVPKSVQAESKAYLGDLVLCTKVIQAQAKSRKIEVKEELVRLVIHGVLHLAGYDHATLQEEKRMFGLQERLVKDFFISV